MLRLLFCVLLLGGLLPAAEPSPPDGSAVATLADRGQAWLLTQQRPEGSFGTVSFTALALESLVHPDGRNADDPALRRALDWLLDHQQTDGGIYSPEEGLGSYCTAFTLLVLARLPETMKDPLVVTAAQNYLRGCQRHEGDAAGGFGYDQGDGPADLSNTATATAALRESGVPADDPAMQRALEFMERCQNLSSHNDQSWAGTDGSAVYSPVAGNPGSWTTETGEALEEAPPGSNPGYGGMTYALITSYVYLELPPEDPRLATAVEWITAHYQFDANPGMTAGREQEGLLYYLMSMAKTFTILGKTVVTLPDGREVDWRADLFAAIDRRAKTVALPDGSEGALWINSAKRWMEGQPVVATCFMLKGLRRIQTSLAANAP